MRVNNGARWSAVSRRGAGNECLSLSHKSQECAYRVGILPVHVGAPRLCLEGERGKDFENKNLPLLQNLCYVQIHLKSAFYSSSRQYTCQNKSFFPSPRKIWNSTYKKYTTNPKARKMELCWIFPICLNGLNDTQHYLISSALYWSSESLWGVGSYEFPSKLCVTFFKLFDYFCCCHFSAQLKGLGNKIKMCPNNICTIEGSDTLRANSLK